ncbi:ArsR/SmtB family transcription factor [Marinicaulis aureus]|uniref:ArsR/SmtB family transcription factor n=1 Tax=Hyphococcus aureus TaxID=2666033 RepID=A0ABW1KVX8_9PROT
MAKFAEMEENAGEATNLLKAMASPHRLMLLCLMADGERSVSELTDELGLRQATVSQHLARLRQEGLVKTRREAQTIYYSIGNEAAAAVIRILYDTYCA